MPYIKFATTKTLTINQEQSLKNSAGQLISILPNKKEENLMIHIEDNQVMYFKGKELDCMKIECQWFHHVDLEYQQEFVKKLMADVEKITKVPVSNQYLTIEEYDHWGKNGELA